jgi:hypothetical protein
MAIVENDPIDGPCLRERLTAWAGFGMYVSPDYPTSLRKFTWIPIGP